MKLIFWWHHPAKDCKSESYRNVTLFFYSQKRPKKAKNKTKNSFLRAVVSTSVSTVCQPRCQP